MGLPRHQSSLPFSAGGKEAARWLLSSPRWVRPMRGGKGWGALHLPPLAAYGSGGICPQGRSRGCLVQPDFETVSDVNQPFRPVECSQINKLAEPLLLVSSFGAVPEQMLIFLAKRSKCVSTKVAAVKMAFGRVGGSPFWFLQNMFFSLFLIWFCLNSVLRGQMCLIK